MLCEHLSQRREYVAVRQAWQRALRLSNGNDSRERVRRHCSGQRPDARRDGHEQLVQTVLVGHTCDRDTCGHVACGTSCTVYLLFLFLFYCRLIV